MKNESFNKMPLFLAMMVIATGQVGVGIYLPALPLISADLAVLPSQAQYIVTGYLVSLGLSQLCYGPIADSIGRRPVFIFGQGLYLVGTLICVLFGQSLPMLVLGRVLQGFGAGSASVIGASILRDSYNGNNLARALSYMSIIAAIMPMVSPVLGGWLGWNFGWHSVFMFVFVYVGTIYFAGCLILPETLPYKTTTPKLKRVFSSYFSLMKSRQVVTSAAYNWINFLMIMVTLSLMPYLLQQELGMSAEDYGLVMVLPTFGLMFGSVIQNVIRRYFTSYQILALALTMSSLSGVWLVCTEMTTIGLIAAFSLLAIAQGFISPVATRLLLEPHRKQAGTVTAFSGAVQMTLTGVLGGWLASWVHSQFTLGLFFIFMTVIMFGLLIYRVYQEKDGQFGTAGLIDEPSKEVC